MPQPTLRPADLAVAAQLCLSPGLSYAALAHRVRLSAGEAHNAVKRLGKAGIVRPDTRETSRNRLHEFLIHGAKYAFPPEFGPEVRGVPTAHSAPPLAAEFVSDTVMVWPFVDGTIRGQSVEPLYPSAPELMRSNPELYTVLTLVDAVRIGQTRERKRAAELLGELLG